MPNGAVAEVQIGDARIEVVGGDITAEEVDAVTNAANDRLQHGGGVAAAIARAGGDVIQEESDAWVEEHGPLRDGEAAVTTAGEMPARWVIHVAGPVYDGASPDNADRLRRAVGAALDAAQQVGATSIALPAISAGTYGYPRDEATRVIAGEVARWLREERGLEVVRLVGFDEGTVGDFTAALETVG